MSLRTWAYATVDFLLASAGLYLALAPAFTVAYALAADATLFAGPPQTAAVVVAVGGSYPFVAGDWSYRRLTVFVVALYVASGAAGLAGLALLRSADVTLPSTVVARAGALAVAYPVAAAAAFRDRVRRRLGFRPLDADDRAGR
ncbi:hypothetical protein [Halosimplex pelagicum]|uniref:Uncharacterized protein n=1 Tax=Halosimplex pelagicum TaxID=869886 RepID=A0A7D5PB56_9EURY|nr:hypothetical protein [Halosimplex pelagicum]QLH83881.1 hypothetical protein HZS54_20595 [Halosimplex pelagicum]